MTVVRNKGNNLRVFVVITILFMSVSACQRPALPTVFGDNGDGFIVIAHRGASGYAPENTMAAFQKAFEMKAEFIELDVMLSKDGVPVLFHDQTLDKKTDGTGEVKEYTFAELQQLDAGSWFSEEFSDEKIPSLEEVLSWASGKMALNIEIKTEAWREDPERSIEPRVVQLVRESGMSDHIIFSSFDYRILRRLNELAPELRTAVLYEPSQSGEKDPVTLVSELQANAFNCSATQLTPEWMNQLKTAGIPVLVYTVNDPEVMKFLMDAGVSGIFTDYPDRLMEVVAQKSRP